MFVTIALTTLLYFLVQLAYVSALPGGSSDEKAPLIDLGIWLAGPAGAAVLTLAAVASLGGNLHGIMASTSRVTSAMAERGDLPRWFARVQPRFVTPANSIAFLAAFAAVLALLGSYVWLAVVSVLARLVIYAVTIAALHRAPERGDVPRWLYAVGAGGIALCIWASFQVDWAAWRTLGILALAGAALYAVARVSGSSRDTASVSAIQPPPSSRDPS
jgi:amino acid transporter